MKVFTLQELLEKRAAKKLAPIPFQELARMVHRCRRATPGKWCVAIRPKPYTIGAPVCYMDENSQMVVGTSGDWGQTADPLLDAEFIAHARMDLPRLLVEVMRLRGITPPDLDWLQLRAPAPSTCQKGGTTQAVAKLAEDYLRP